MVKLGDKKVIIAARRQDELDRVKAECKSITGANDAQLVETFKLDLSQPEKCLRDCQALNDKVLVDILVNNGGLLAARPVRGHLFLCVPVNDECQLHVAYRRLQVSLAGHDIAQKRPNRQHSLELGLHGQLDANHILRF